MSSKTAWPVVLLLLVAVRVLSLSAYPLHDTTEARYADIARLMVVTGEWVTPQISRGTPFWAKPPLSIWATAVSFAVLGFSEFAARLPALIFMLGAALNVFFYCRHRSSTHAGMAACVVFLGSGLGFVGAGAVMTDAALTLAVTLSVIAFARHISEPRTQNPMVFFAGLGLGLLAKGPVAVVLIAVPVALWSLRYRSLYWLWCSLPWLRGTLLVCGMALPWYIAAEVRTPGFLNYFLIGEHFMRFVDSGWSGDLYGNAHERPTGTIWLYGLAGLLPWTLFVLPAVGQWLSRRSPGRRAQEEDRFLLLAALSPMLFFTLAGNVLPAYVMPSLAPFSVLLGQWLCGRTALFSLAGLVVPVAVLVLMYTGILKDADVRSEKGTLADLARFDPQLPVYYFERMPHSASFYSKGAASQVDDIPALNAVLKSAEGGWLLVRSKHERRLGAEALHCLELVDLRGRYTVFSMASCARPGLASRFKDAAAEWSRASSPPIR